MLIMKITHEFHSQILRPNSRMIAYSFILHQNRKPICEKKKKVNSTFPLDPKPSLVPLCRDVILATLPNGSSAGSPLIIGQEMKYEEFHLENSVLLRDFFFLPKTFILKRSNFICFDDITGLTESTEVSQ